MLCDKIQQNIKRSFKNIKLICYIPHISMKNKRNPQRSKTKNPVYKTDKPAKRVNKSVGYRTYKEKSEQNPCRPLIYLSVVAEGEFLEMAARLIYIKTAALLPKPEEAEKMKKELEGELIELSLCKIAARELAERNVGSSIFVRKPMKIKADMTYALIHAPETLAAAYNAVSCSKRLKPEQKKIHIENKINAVVKRKIVPVMTKVVL